MRHALKLQPCNLEICYDSGALVKKPPLFMIRFTVPTLTANPKIME
jgi:hypothetical protein